MIQKTKLQMPIFVVMANRFFSIKDKFVKVDDLGWSSTVEEAEGRVLNKNGKFNLIRKGEQYHIYHLMISMTWLQFFSFIFVTFTLVNGFFALVYYIIGSENLSGFVSKGFFLDIVNLFHFSVQTMTTVGYGAMHPTGIATGVVASLEALVGLMSFAIVSGLMFGRFSNPKAEIKYAKHMLMTRMGDKPVLQARIANKLSHDLFDVRARILMLHNERNDDGTIVKRYKTLKLHIDNISFLPMNWTITHFIDSDSPLYKMTRKDLDEQKVEFLVLITAFDDSFSQVVHSRSSYVSGELLFNEQWAKTYYVNEEGQRVFDMERLDMLKDKNVQE